MTTSPIFSGPTAWADALVHGTAAAAQAAREAAAARRDPSVVPPTPHFDIGKDGVAAWNAMLAADQQAGVVAKPPEAQADEFARYDSWSDAMEAGALDMPGYTPPPSGPEEIAARFEQFQRNREGQTDAS